MFLPFELFCLAADVALTRLIGTLVLALGAGTLLASFRSLSDPAPGGVVGGGLISVRPGSVSLPQLVALSAGLSCVVAGLLLWVK